MDHVKITVSGLTFRARWEYEASPRTCAAFQALLPYSHKLIHARWSGEACWIPLGTFDLGVPAEHPTGEPRPGQLLFYPGGISETEILLPYGVARFSSVVGPLGGNRLLTITDDLDQLARLGKDILWNGAREIRFEAAL
jgi:hypothetical protein